MKLKQTRIWKFFSSVKLAIWLLAIIAVLSLVGTFIPQNEDPAFYIQRFGSAGYNFLLQSGLAGIYSAWWFILFLVLLSLNLSVCLLNRISFKARLMGTLISHLSILVILAGALMGMFFGEKGYIKINEAQTINSFESKGKIVSPGFSLRLDDFIYEEQVDPKEKLLVYSKDKTLLGEFPVFLDKEFELNNSLKLKILRFIPDFSMNLATKEVVSRSNAPRNPAIELELKGKDAVAKTFWAFANYPDMHQEVSKDFTFVYRWAMRRPKDFISKVTIIKEGRELLSQDIRVNHPLRFGGYAFFQSSYDKENLSWSGLQAVKDPGVAVVYLGFLMLIFGLIIIFYVNPFLKRG